MAGDVHMRSQDIKFKRDRSIDLGSKFGDGNTNRQTDRRFY